MWFINYLIAVIVVYLVGYVYVRRKYAYFADRNVLFVEPKFPLGNFGGVGTKVNFVTKLTTHYQENVVKNVKYFGMFVFFRPILVIMDLDLVKTILVKDFQHFQDRGMYVNEKDDPLTGHLFNLAGDRWRNLRAKLSPTFTSGKMKMMFPIIVAVAEEFDKTIRASLVESPEIEMKDFLARFTTDVIGNCAFGLECNSLKDPNAEFRKYGRQIVEPNINMLKQLLVGTLPSLAKALGITVTDKDIERFFMESVRDTIAHREANDVQRNDFMSLLIQLKNHEDPASRLTIEEIAAQSFVFFFAGFETSSTAMSLALYELSQNQMVQNKARECVRRVLERHGGKMTYEAMTEMGYIEQCIKESLRKYPPIGGIVRIASNDYTLPDSEFTLPKGTMVFVPTEGFHHNPDFFPDPEVYDPDRFDPELEAARNPYTYLPFGEGPRNCIGLRFGMMQARIGLALLLRSFRFEISNKTCYPLKFSVKAPILSIDGGLWLKVTKV